MSNDDDASVNTRRKMISHSNSLCLRFILQHANMWRIGQRTWSTFGLWGDGPAPGVQVEHHSRMMFVDCQEHFKVFMTAMNPYDVQ
jgi:hypothetical protein